MLGVADQTYFANVPSAGLRTTCYIVMCDINMTTFDKRGSCLVRGSRIFQGIIPYGVAR